MNISESNIKSSRNTKDGFGVKSANQVLGTLVSIKAIASPNASEINALSVMFNNGQLVESELLAISFTQRYPIDGFGWKVLGAILQMRGFLDQASDALQKAAEFLPKDSEAQYNLGNFFYDKQQLDDAAKYYKKAIKLSPNFAKAHYNLGNVLKNQNSLELAKVSYKNALRFEPNNIQAAFNLAQLFYEQEVFNESIAYFKKAICIQEDFSAAHVGLGACFQSMGKFAEAEECFRKAISHNANDIEAQNNLGGTLKILGRLAEAECCYRTVLSITPESPDAYIKLGSLLKSMGNSAESADCFAKALSINSLLEEAQNDLGLALADQGRFLEAEICYQNAIKLAPNFWKAHNNLGLSLHSMGRFKEAENAFEKAINLNPNEALIYSNLSLPLVAQGQIKKAEFCLKKAIEINPEYVNGYINLGTNCLAQGLAKEAEFAFLQALKFDQNSTKAKSNLLFTLNYSGGHTAEYRLEHARQYSKIVDEKVQYVFTSWQQVSDVKRLKIGLVSGDLRQHPVAYFLENWAKYIDSSQFELIAYTTDSREDDVTAKLKPHFSGWRSLVGLNDQAAAELIYKDGIHILMDLSGHTAENRLPVFAFRPAPIQVSWLGYFATTGMTSIDYFIADGVGVPEQNKTQFIEKVKYIPDTRLCFTAPSLLVEISPLPAITNGYITFASFQTLVKASDDVLTLWAGVMLALPNSKLRWQCKSFADTVVVEDLKCRFAKHGIDSDRLVLLESVSRDSYLKAHSEVDIILDTFPYPGGTTTCEALFMGVPTLTLVGDTLIARQGASLMMAAGLSEWVVGNKTDYVNKAISFTSDINNLSQLRMQLRDQVLSSTLFDAQKFSKNMEKALWEMWDEKLPIVSKHNLNQDKIELVTINHADEAVAKISTSDLVIVSSTTYSESEFWAKSPLGLSLPRHCKQDSRFSVNIAFENSLGLSEVFNEAINQAKDDAVLIFIHDNVWIDEANFAENILEGLAHFDVIGVAGNRRRLHNQPSWAFIDTQFTWDDNANLSGRIAHGRNAFGEIEVFGDTPAECELLDGVFLATKKSTLNQSALRFDSQFDSDFFDMDFCRSARAKGLKLGTCPISLTQQSTVSIGSAHWREKYRDYLNKWERAFEMTSSSEVMKSNLDSQELLNVISEVFQMALDHQNSEQREQAELLYKEILNIQPLHTGASHNLGLLEVHSKGAVVALPRLELAVKNEPSNEKFWISYIETLIHSGAIETAVDALELGQKFGLGKETAQTIAQEFVNDFEMRVIDVLDNDKNKQSESSSLTISKLNQDTPIKFLIVAPYYTDKSAGIVVMHTLCDSLNKLGHKAAMILTGSGQYTIFNDDICYGPSLQKYKLNDKKEFNEFIRDGVVIYPEIETGNPLGGTRVVRYILNREGFIANNCIDASESDFILAFSKLYHNSPHAYLIKLPFNPIFNSENSVACLDRALDVTYIGKGDKYSQCFVIPNTLEVNRQWPSSKHELALLFRNTRFFYTWDTVSQTNIDALFCGAIPVFMNPAPFITFDEIESEIGQFPMATATITENNDVTLNMPDDFALTLARFKANYTELVSNYDSRLLAVVDKIYQHFSR